MAAQKTGRCHCGAVTWEAALPDEIVADECNCSMCEMVGFLHVIVPRSKFKLLTGDDHLTEYRFNTGTARHWFCKTCGVKSFYIPRSNPDGYALNLRCMDRSQFAKIEIRPFDGQNWEANASKLAHLSKGD
ncbi:GFA family protein [Hyphococcus sp.]|uniref:GFA family protein n=1 Tax=Hyphococcus sp. TaxID=2038636 RepID=UPI0035C7831F